MNRLLTDAHLTSCATLAGIEVSVSLATGGYGVHLYHSSATTLSVCPIGEASDHP